MFVNGSGRNEQSQQRTFHRCFLPSFGSFGQMISVEKNLKNQKQESPVAAMFVNRSGRNEQFYRGPSIDTSYQVSVHLCASGFRGEYFKNQPIRNKSRLWRPCLLTDRDEMSKVYRGSSIDASYQISVHLAKRFQRRFLKICIEITAFWIQISIFKQELTFF